MPNSGPECEKCGRNKELVKVSVLGLGKIWVCQECFEGWQIKKFTPAFVLQALMGGNHGNGS